MMPMTLYFILVLMIIFSDTVWSRTTRADNFSSESFLMNTEELDDSALRYLGSLPVLPKINLKPILKKTHLNAYKSGCLDTKGLYFVKSFECAIDTIKWSLQLIFKHFEEIFQSQHFQDTIRNQPKELPLDIMNIYNTRDEWIDHPQNETTPSGKSRPLDKLLDYFQKWYYIITCNETSPTVGANITVLQAELDQFYNDFKPYFGDRDSFLQRCAAHLARSFMLTNAFDYDLQRKIREAVFKAENVDVPFEELFFRIIPNWYVREEQIAFLNIIRSIATEQESFSPLQSLFTRNKWNGTAEVLAEPDYVCIPYDESDLCGRVDFKKTTKNTPFAYSFNSIVYTRRYITKPATILNLNSITST